MSAGRGALSRRQFGSALGAAAGVAATAGSAQALGSVGAADTPSATGPEPSDEVRGLFGELRGGARVDRWTIEAVHPVTMGAIPVVLRTAEGTAFQVDVLRRGGRPGVANTPSLSLYLANRGDGTTATDEEQGLGAMALADALTRREASGAAIPPALCTFDERRMRHPVGGYDVLSGRRG